MRISGPLFALCLFSFFNGDVGLAQSISSALPEIDADISAQKTNISATSSPVWLYRNPSNVPSPRSYIAIAYDAVRQQVILFGGYSGSSYLNGTVVYDGTAWRKVFTPVAPSPRVNAQMAYDEMEKVVLFGGYNGTSHLNTWLWDGSTSKWTQATPVHSPAAVTGPMLFTDPNGKVDEFGGYDGNRYQGTVWRWTGTELAKAAASDGSVQPILRRSRIQSFAQPSRDVWWAGRRQSRKYVDL